MSDRYDEMARALLVAAATEPDHGVWLIDPVRTERDLAAMLRALSQCSTPDASGNLPPFAGALEWWLRRRLGERAK